MPRCRRIEPEPILATEVHHGQNPGRSIRAAGDLAPSSLAPRCSSPAAPTRPTARAGMHVRLAVFAGERPLLDKWLLVQDPAGFARMPLVYERALRGPTGADNLRRSRRTRTSSTLPHPDRAAGFGPIARTWPARSACSAAVPRREARGAPIAEIPDDFDWSYYQAAPPGQQTDILRGDEWIVLEGLSSSALLRTRLPDARSVARLHGALRLRHSEGQPLGSARPTRSPSTATSSAVPSCGARASPSPPRPRSPRRAIARGVSLPGEPPAWPDPRSIDALAVRPVGAQAVNPRPSRSFSNHRDDAATIALPPFAAPAPVPAVPFRAGAPSAEVGVPAARLPLDSSPSTGTFMLDPSPRAPAPRLALQFALRPPLSRRARLFHSARARFRHAAAYRLAPVEHVPTGTLSVMDAPRPASAPLPFAAPISPPASTARPRPW